jgi:hypothetical protein
METQLVGSDRSGSQAAATRRESSLMHTVNSNLRERSEAVDRSESIAFFCECKTPSCFAPVWLSVDDFDLVAAADAGWLLIAGHEPSALWHRRAPLPTRHTARPARSVRRRLGSLGAQPVAQ